MTKYTKQVYTYRQQAVQVVAAGRCYEPQASTTRKWVSHKQGPAQQVLQLDSRNSEQYVQH